MKKIIKITCTLATTLCILCTTSVLADNGVGIEVKTATDNFTEPEFARVVVDPDDEHGVFHTTLTLSGRTQVEEEILTYINEFRVAEGKCEMKMATGKSREFARGRADQLVTNFEHNVEEARALATQLKYGNYKEYVEDVYIFDRDVTVSTNRVISYYQWVGGEAIGQGSKNDIEGLVHALHNSAGHWEYIGHENNDYIAIGVTESNSFLYVCLLSLKSELVEQYD